MWPFKKKFLGRKYTWKPDLPDQRDYRYSIKSQTILRSQVDLRNLCPPVRDQGSLGSCTGHALTSALEILEAINNVGFVPMSRLFVYYNERELEGTVSEDSGAQIRDGIKSLAAKGCCHESLWPYNVSKFTKKPTATAYKNGLKHRITQYARLNTLLDMKTCLAAGFPFVFGFSVYESFESDIVSKTGVVLLPDQNERCIGGHAVCCVGYNADTQRLLVRNSWGPNWGQGGYFTLPFSYVTNRNLSDDFWVIKSGINLK